MVRHVATDLANDGKRVRVCVQGSMGKGVFQALPIALSGARRVMELMDWGPAEDFISLGAVGAEEVKDEDDAYLIVAPQSIVGHSILPPLMAHCEAAGPRPVVLVNALLGDIQSADGVMTVRGRDVRDEQRASFGEIYHFHLLYNKPFMYPIYGCLRKTYGSEWEVYKRSQLKPGPGGTPREEWRFSEAFDEEPVPAQITRAVQRAV